MKNAMKPLFHRNEDIFSTQYNECVLHSNLSYKKLKKKIYFIINN